MSQQPTIFLFDIDGTLIRTGGVGREAIIRTLQAVYDASCDVTFSFAGMTDRAIIRRGLHENGITVSEQEIDRVIEAYLQRLPDEIARAQTYFVCPGVYDVLDVLHRESNPQGIGLGTGNVEKGARIKLERGNLNDYFSFGGFGCMSELRPELIRKGAQRGGELMGVDYRDCRVVIIGDTPLDIAAAHAMEAECVAVATGGASYHDLERCNPEYLFTDLEQPGVIDALLGA